MGVKWEACEVDNSLEFPSPLERTPMPLSDRDYMRQPSSRTPTWLANWTPLHWIIAINIVVFAVQHLGGAWVDLVIDPVTKEPSIREHGGVSIEALAQGRFWTAFTYMFVHGTLLHLIGNLLLIGFVGHRVQALLGPRNFLLIYFASGLAGAALQLVIYWWAYAGQSIDLIGASASACGLLLAFATIMPEERITTLLYFIIPISARLWTLAMVMMGIELVLGFTALFWTDANDMWGQTAYFAHLGGAFAGWNFVRLLGYGGNPMTYERLWRDRVPSRPQRREVARVRRAAAVPDMDMEAARRKQQQARPSLPIMDDVDRILDKISTQGMSSLSDDEKRILDDASRVIAQRGKPGKS